MDIETMSKENFQKYKSDWSYPLYIRRAFVSGIAYKGRCVTFQAALKVTLIVGQCFGIMPVIGVCNDDVSKLRLEPLDRKAGSLYYSISALSAFVNTEGIKLQINLFHTLVTNECHLDRLVEHVLSDLHDFAITQDCNPEENIYKAFMNHCFPWTFDNVTYNHFFGFVAQYLNIQCTFNWNFADVFVICMSMYLQSRLEQVNQKIEAVRGTYVPFSFWRTMREEYTRVTNLARTVNDIIGGVVFISFANNLFFICLQLLHTLAPLKVYEEAVYFVYFFIFLIVRSLVVSLAAADVHTATKASAVLLYQVSSDGYCIEIAGTIVTYELVLMQFTRISPTSATPV